MVTRIPERHRIEYPAQGTAAVAPEGGALEDPSRWPTNVQTTGVPAGGATVVEFRVELPGTYVLVDHSLSRAGKGGTGQLVVEGAENPDIYKAGR